MKIYKSCLIFTAVILFGCQENEPYQAQPEQKLNDGPYRFALQIDKYELPFNASFQFNKNDNTLQLIITNGEERIVATDVSLIDDSVIVYLPVFNSTLSGRIESPSLISGSFVKHDNANKVSIPFVAEHDKSFRFTNTKSSVVLPQRYKARFQPDTQKEYPAVLLMDNDQGKLTATFLTETGDYRFLEGNIMNDKIYLSTFDGSHAFYFEAAIDGDRLNNGVFRSGPTYEAKWEAVADTTYDLTNPFRLTTPADSATIFNISLPNQDGDSLNWERLGLKGKVVIIDVFGSWCPNCKDAAIALDLISKKYPPEEIEIVPVAFELTENLQVAKKRVFKMQRDLGLEQGFLFGGYASKQNASSKFPMLNHIMSFPTIIVIDRKQKIRSIYTGFYGPGTGPYYDQFMVQMETLITSLINEP